MKSNHISLTLLLFLLLVALGGNNAFARNLSPLAAPPDWSELDPFQATISHDEFTRLLEHYAPDKASADFIRVDDTGATIRTGSPDSPEWRLRFSGSASSTSPPRYWAIPVPREAQHPLAGLHVALDPGHLGGRWARMEERWFQLGAGTPVTEGDMTLYVARLLAPKLAAMGAEISWVRDSTDPLTGLRPEDLLPAARRELTRQGIQSILPDFKGPTDPDRTRSLRWESELLFYRTAEIHARGRFVNGTIQPDVVLCLHFNAEPWGDPQKPSLVQTNHFHLLVNGNYSASELALDDVRFEMLRKLLNRSLEPERTLSDRVATEMATRTGLPPYRYTTKNARPLGQTGYVWSRNLMANRLYECPVLYFEPYVMNSEEAYARIQAGDYEGEREIAGRMRPSIFKEYADAVAAGLAAAFRVEPPVATGTVTPPSPAGHEAGYLPSAAHQ